MNTLLKKLLMVALTLPVLAFAQTSSKVVATVASEPITTKDVEERMAVNLVVISQQNGKLLKPTEKEKEELKIGSLDELIQERIFLDKARKLGIKVSDSEVSEAIANLSKLNQITTEQFKANVIKQNGASAWTSFQRDLKNQMIMDKLKKQEVLDKITAVKPSEIDALLAEKKLGAKNPLPEAPGVNVVFIITKTAKQLETAKARIAKGEAFEKVAAEVSELTNSVQTTSFINFSDKGLDPAVTSALKNLKDGDVSNIVKNKNGAFTLFKVIDHKPMVYTLEQQKSDAKQTLMQQKAEAAYKTWFEALMANAEKNNLVVMNPVK